MLLNRDRKLEQERKEAIAQGRGQSLAAKTILEAPSSTILSRVGDRDKFASAILDYLLVNYPASTNVAVLDSFSGTFQVQRLHPVITSYQSGAFNVVKEIARLQETVDTRMMEIGNGGDKNYSGSDMFVFINEFSLFDRNEYGGIGSLVHILVRARQSKVHLISFDDPDTMKADHTSFFSATAALIGNLPPKFNSYIQTEYRKRIRPGKVYINYMGQQLFEI